jgi:hypothetical protein
MKWIILFCALFLSVNPSITIFFYYQRTYRRTKNYRRKIHRQSISVGDFVGKLITNGMIVQILTENFISKYKNCVSDCGLPTKFLCYGNNDELKKKVIFKYLSSTVDWWVELIMTRRALTYNVSRKHNSQIKATLIWTVNDLLAYEMVSGWSIHRKLSCLYYMHHNKAFILFNSVKLFFYCYQRFLPSNYQFRNNKKRLLES